MKIKLYLFLLFCMGFSFVYGQNPNHVLWYENPAANWNEALPIGNGRIGGMIFGNPSKDQIQLNEETVWAGEPGNNVPLNTSSEIVEIRNLLFKGKNKEAQELANATYPRTPPEDSNYGMPYQTVGNLFIDFEGHDKVKNYRRSLDIQQAIAGVEYDFNDVHFSRKYFVSYPDKVMVVHLKADKPGQLSFELNFNSPQEDHQVSTENGTLKLTGTSGDFNNKTGKIKFQTFVVPKLISGKVIENDESLEIEAADEVLLFVSIGTNFKNYKDLSNSAEEMAQKYLDAAKSKTISQLEERHLEDYQELYNRVSLDLGESVNSTLPTNLRLENFSENNDLSLVSLYFQFGRYLLISSSRPGGQPANLQGIWNHQLAPPWDSKYTVNINTEMNYWPAESTNLSELHQPLFQMLKELSVTGRESAKEMYNARGWNMHHNTDIWRVTGIIDGGFYGFWPMGGAWLSQHIWEHYLYTGDKEFLEEYYDVLKTSARFYADVLEKEPENQWLVVGPSISPENKYQGDVGVSYGTTMDNQLVFDIFSNTIASAEILNRDSDFINELKAKRKRLPPMQIGQHGQLQEWIKDWDDPDDKHRHISHLYGLHPSNQISPFKNPELFSAAEQTLRFRGDKSTGWSMGWKVNFWARLLNGEKAYDLIKTQLTLVEDGAQDGGTYPNLLDAHPPFQIDGNFGCTAGVAEMLVQSHDEAIHLLPALPKAWAKGSVNGLKARGGFEVDIKWQESKFQELEITSALGGVCHIRVEGKLFDEHGNELPKVSRENPNPFYKNNTIKEPIVSDKTQAKAYELPDYNLYEIDTKQGETYRFNAGK